MKFHPKTLIISGNGSVYWKNPENLQKESNAWELVQKCAEEIKASPEGKGVGIPCEAENLLHWLASTEKLIAYFSEHPPHDKTFLDIQKVLKKFREKLGKTFKEADICLRNLYCFNCENHHSIDPINIPNCGVLTLNWDGSVRNFPNTIELHGSCEFPETMVLPNQDLTRLLPKNRIMNQGCESFALAHHWFADCKNVIIWGCQLNDYDAIISTILSIFTLTFAKGRIGIFISNPNFEVRQKIEARLKDYLPLATFYSCLNKIPF